MIAEEPKVRQEPGPHRWNRREYHTLADLGLFDRRKVELLDGTIYEHPGDAEPHPIRWSRPEYSVICESVLDRARVELIEGTVYDMPAMKRPHWASQIRTRDLMIRLFGPGFTVSQNAPLRLLGLSDPEPDVAVIPGELDDYPDDIAPHAILVIEISDTSLMYDRTIKASLYARAGIQDYWLVNLVERVLEVYRQPHVDAAQPHGFGYASTTRLARRQTIAPLALPEAVISVSQLMP